jgi:hypothetical protein
MLLGIQNKAVSSYSFLNELDLSKFGMQADFFCEFTSRNLSTC